MNLEDLVDENGLQQDEWSLTTPTFGEDNQLTVVGWSGKCFYNKHYILKCMRCSEDLELFGQGYFRSIKGNLVKGQIPCGCAFNPKWSKEQYYIICSRKAKELNYTFLGFIGVWRQNTTKIRMFCGEHGEWSGGRIADLINQNRGCPACGRESTREASTKPEDVLVQSFRASGGFHPDTEFWRSGRLTKKGYKGYWYMSCTECGEIGESYVSNLQRGHRPCACSKHRQQECYINLIISDNLLIAIKFGIANSSKLRTKQQNSSSVYLIEHHSAYHFPDVSSCKRAERECKQELETGIVSKAELPDGYTETTYAYNLDKIVEIYERNGGIRVD